MSRIILFVLSSLLFVTAQARPAPVTSDVTQIHGATVSQMNASKQSTAEPQRRHRHRHHHRRRK